MSINDPRGGVCEGCPLRHKSNYCGPTGLSSSKIVLIGEAPGENENRLGEPFVGAAGYYLDQLLAGAGIGRAECYITNVLKCRPPKNNMKSQEAITALRLCQPRLLAELRDLNPNVVVPMGNYSLQALGFRYRIGDARGAVADAERFKVIPTYHPAYLFREWSEIYTVEKDWKKIRKHSMYGNMPYIREDFVIAPTIEDIEMFTVHVQHRLNMGEQLILGIDIETYIVDNPIDTAIKTVSIAINKERVYVVPFITQAGNYYWSSKELEIRAIMAIGKLLEDPRLTKMAHNGMFDFFVLMNHGFTIDGDIYDTEIAQYLIYHLSKHSLAYVVSIYADYLPWKLTAGKDDRSFREYNARDNSVMHMVKSSLDEDLIDNGLMQVFQNLMRVILPTCRIMLNGVHLDPIKYTEVKNRLESTIDSMESNLGALAGVPGLNLNSPAQIRDLLFGKMKLKSAVKTKGGKRNGKGATLSVDEGVLKKLSIRYPNNAFIDGLLDYRQITKQYGTYIKNVKTKSDGRVHTSLKLHTAVTGRYTSSAPNLLNLPKRKDREGYIRGMFTAPPGKMIVEGDFSQEELMIFAVMANDEPWLQAFAEGRDIHRDNMIAMIGEYDERYRTFIKNFVYGLIYGSKGQEIAKVAPRELIERISIDDMLSNLRGTHPAVFSYMEQIEYQIKTKKYVLNAYGRRRWYPNKNITNSDIREAINFPIQSTAADIMHEITPKLESQLEYPADKIILPLYDAYYLEVPEGRTDHVCHILKSLMETPIETPLGYTFALRADIDVGTSLSSKDMQPWKDEQDAENTA